MKLNKALILATTAFAGLCASSLALAQSTATQELETTVVVKGARKSAAGVGVDQTVTKTRSSITDEYLATQAPGSPLDAINILPGVNFTDQDATGSVGFDITLRGFDSQRIALILDGLPLNDTGNYAVYPSMNIDSELYSRIDVNLGSTDVDSPTAAAGGGTINFVTKRPADAFGVEAKETLGDHAFARSFFRLDTGKFGPWGTTAFLTYSNLYSDKWKGYGKVKRQQWNGGLYQPLDNGDFIAAYFTYNHSRNNSYYDVSASEYDADYETDYAGTIDSKLSTAVGSGSGAYYGWKINPTNNGNIRMQSKFHLRDNLILTVDPSFQYTLADGGTQVKITGGPVATMFEGRSRPGHFDGVLTVVAKLLNIVRPEVVTFGQKDAQQLFLVQRMVRDLDVPVRVEVIPIVREPDGLAMSTRNRYLGPEDRKAAAALSRAGIQLPAMDVRTPWLSDPLDEDGDGDGTDRLAGYGLIRLGVCSAPVAHALAEVIAKGAER